MLDLGKKNVLGVRINAVDYAAAVQKIIAHAKSGSSFGVSALAVHGVMTGVLDATHRHRLNGLELIVPDGQPVRWALNLLHETQLTDRVYGPTLMLKTCEAAAAAKIPIYLFGSTASILEDLERNLTDQFPQLIIAGKQASRFRTLSAEEKAQVVSEIKSSGAGITFVGLGCPRQAVWAYEFKDDLNMPVLAVGAAFAFHAGQLAQAPSAMQRAGLEWLYRLGREPNRLWRRYALLNPQYVYLLTLQWAGMRKFDPTNTTAPSDETRYG